MVLAERERPDDVSLKDDRRGADGRRRHWLAAREDGELIAAVCAPGMRAQKRRLLEIRKQDLAVVAVLVTRSIFLFSFETFWTAIATAELVRSVIISTPSRSYQRRAMLAATSGLF